MLTRRLAAIGITLCIALIGLYVISRGGWLDGLLAGITLAMGVLPQEFPVIMIVFMAFGARRIAHHRVLTRHLNAIETLGETTVLCVNKTGTLTENRMAVAILVVNERQFDVSDGSDAASLAELPEDVHELLEYCVLASEIEPHDPMEKAFHQLARKYLANTEHLHSDWDLAREYELSPELMAMSHLWRIPDHAQQAVACKGAPEAIADLCHLDSAACARVARQAAELGASGLRVLGVAKATHHADAAWPTIQHDFEFEFLGLVGLADPLRAEDFFKSVSGRFKIKIDKSNASEIIDSINQEINNQTSEWSRIGNSKLAQEKANENEFVIGLKGDSSSNPGQIVIVIEDTSSSGNFPTAYWGGDSNIVGMKNVSTENIWKDLSKVVFLEEK